jgi:hypothetical protein
MCRVISSLAAGMLSVLMILTSVSASACDLSCWLRKAHSDCHATGSAAQSEEIAMAMSSPMDMRPGRQPVVASHMHADATTDDSMAMSPNMDMGPYDGKSAAGPGGARSAAPRHSMSMSPQLEGTTERFVRVSKAEARMAMPDHSGTLSSCKHEPCRQASISASPPTGDHPQPISVHWMPTSISNPANLWIDRSWIGPGPPPPKIPAAVRLTTALKI